MLDTIRLKNKIKIFIAVKIKKIVAQGCQRTKSILEQREKKKKKAHCFGAGKRGFEESWNLNIIQFLWSEKEKKIKQWVFVIYNS